MAGPQAERQLALLERIYDSDAPRQAIADELHMHRTSLYNHVQRIADVIGVDPLVSSVRLDLHLALKVRRWQQRPTFELHRQWARTRRDH
jgi:PucR family transcriptional regulator, proline-responsive transcriptional activator